MDAYIKQVIIFINQADGLLLMSVCFLFFKSGEFGNSEIDVRHKISRLQGLKIAQR
jgi:hypothetical protein